MNSFRLIVSSPSGHIYNGEAIMLTLRGADGELAVMAGHVPFVTTVKAGECKIVIDEDTERRCMTDGGLLTVSLDKVTLLSGSFRWIE